MSVCLCTHQVASKNNDISSIAIFTSDSIHEKVETNTIVGLISAIAIAKMNMRLCLAVAKEVASLVVEVWEALEGGANSGSSSVPTIEVKHNLL